MMLFAMMLISTLCLVACNFNDEKSINDDSATYIIQYSDDLGTHRLEVQNGTPFALEKIPYRLGYEFMGLFDAESGGTQYVNSKGSSVSVFNEGRHMVLFPQFRLKEYKVVLDYQYATNGGGRDFIFTYGAQIEGLPSMLLAPNKIFMGWYTLPDCKGLKIADEYGTPTATSTLDNSTFNISDNTNFVSIYAGFKGAPCDITLYIKGDAVPKTIESEYGTPASEITYDYVSMGKNLRVVAWSKDSFSVADRKAFTGEINGSITLYSLSSLEWGTASLPYQVSSRSDFEKMLANSTQTSYYELTQNIDLGDWSEKGSYNWASESRNAPVAFTGNFNGNNHTISYLVRIGKTSLRSWAFGLFPTTANANIKNLKVNANITTYDPLGRNQKWDIHNDDRAQDAMVGGIIGYAKNTILTNCSTSGNIRFNSDGGGSDTCVAGVIGYALSSTIDNCSSSATVYSRGFFIAIAGVVACHFHSTCNNLTSNAKISADNDWWFGEIHKNSTVARPNHEVLTKN